MITRLAPLVGMLTFFGIGFCWRAWLQHRRFGTSGLVLLRTGRWRRNLADLVFLALLVGLFAQAIAFAVQPDGFASLTAVRLFDPLRSWGVGFYLMPIGTFLMVVAQLQLGASWRIGIDEDARPGLMTGGLYRLCRNPIFLAMFIVLAGYTALIPTWLSLALFVGTVVAIRRQVVEEEAYLSRTYGDDYRAYAIRVGRFVPGVGRLD